MRWRMTLTSILSDLLASLTEFLAIVLSISLYHIVYLYQHWIFRFFLAYLCVYEAFESHNVPHPLDPLKWVYLLYSLAKCREMVSNDIDSICEALISVCPPHELYRDNEGDNLTIGQLTTFFLCTLTLANFLIGDSTRLVWLWLIIGRCFLLHLLHPSFPLQLQTALLHPISLRW